MAKGSGDQERLGRGERSLVAALSLATYVTVLVNTVFFPIFPEMARELHLNLRHLAWFVVIVSFPAAVLSPIAGILADGWGRKRIMVPSLLLLGLGGALGGAAALWPERSFAAVLGARFLQGVGAAAPLYLATALTGDTFQSRSRIRAMGYLESSNAVGKMTSPILGGLLGALAWYAPFFLYPLLAWPAAYFVWRGVREENRRPVNWRREFKALERFGTPSRGLILMVGFIVLFGLIGTLFWLSDLLEARLPSAGEIRRGLVLALPLTALVGLALVSGRVSRRIGLSRTMAGGMLVMACALAVIPFVVDHWSLWVLTTLLGASAGLILPALDTVSSALAAGRHRGVMTSTIGGSRSLGAAVAPYLFAALLEGGVVRTFLPTSLLTLLAGLALLGLRDERILPRQPAREFLTREAERPAVRKRAEKIVNHRIGFRFTIGEFRIPTEVWSVQGKWMARAAILAGLTGVLAYLQIPFTPVPITGQTFGVMLAGMLLGARWGSISMLVYLLLGAVGVPVFAGGSAGFGVLLGPTGGYIWGFVLGAGVVGRLAGTHHRPVAEYARGLAACVAGGIGVVYAAGTLHYALVAGVPWQGALAVTALPFLPGDLLKAIVAASLGISVRRALIRSRLLPPGQDSHVAGGPVPPS